MNFFDIDSVDFTKLQSVYVMVTPDMAEKMLDRNFKNNRQINQTRVAHWLSLMNSGRFDFSNPVVFSKSGVLINGQHRLTALSKCGSAQPFHVSTGYEDSAIEILDQGMPRSSANVIALRGIKNVQYFVPMLNIAIQLAERKVINKIIFSPSEYADLAEIYSETFNIGVTGRNGNSSIKIAPVMCSAVLSSFSQDHDRIQCFLKVWHSGMVVNGAMDNAALLLRNTYQKDRLNGVIHSRDYAYKFALKTQVALKHFFKGKSPSRLVDITEPLWAPSEFSIPSLKATLAKKKAEEVA